MLTYVRVVLTYRSGPVMTYVRMVGRWGLGGGGGESLTAPGCRACINTGPGFSVRPEPRPSHESGQESTNHSDGRIGRSLAPSVDGPVRQAEEKLIKTTARVCPADQWNGSIITSSGPGGREAGERCVCVCVGGGGGRLFARLADCTGFPLS